MTAVVYGSAVPAPARRMIGEIEDRLRSWGVLDAAEGVVVAVGADDARLAARAGRGRRVLVPALASRKAPAWSSALLGAARAVVVFDGRELAALPGQPAAPVVVAGLPRAHDARRGEGLDTGCAPPHLVGLWSSLSAERAPGHGGAGVAWVGGGVLGTLCAAREAWAARRAVVVLPGTRRHPMLRGAALVARTPLEVIEATRYLCENRPLARALADMGYRRASALDAPDEVARRVAEAIVLAGG